MQSESISLYELNALVHKVLEETLPDTYWVQVELADVRVNASGHCYVEFVQKTAHDNTLLAKARGVIWADRFRMLKSYFEEETGQSFASGVKVLVEVSVHFHELYGYSLTVHDIDPSYTVGDLARRRHEILRQLDEEGVLTLNKDLSMPLLPQRIAVISSPTAAGYGDFCHQLKHNPRGYYFQVKLFPAVMQGGDAEDSILAALDDINARLSAFDVVVIIRGGGAISDLSCFDTYLLAAACAQFPLPIITGIGHERDNTVLDCVAHTRVKTPTAAAEYLICRVDEAADALYSLAVRLRDDVQERLQQERLRIENLRQRIPTAAYRCISEARLQLLMLRKDISAAASSSFASAYHRLEILRQRLLDASPEKQLARGFSMTLKDGRIVKDVSMLRAGDQVITRLYKGDFCSVVEKKSVEDC